MNIILKMIFLPIYHMESVTISFMAGVGLAITSV